MIPKLRSSRVTLRGLFTPMVLTFGFIACAQDEASVAPPPERVGHTQLADGPPWYDCKSEFNSAKAFSDIASSLFVIANVDAKSWFGLCGGDDFACETKVANMTGWLFEASFDLQDAGLKMQGGNAGIQPTLETWTTAADLVGLGAQNRIQIVNAAFVAGLSRDGARVVMGVGKFSELLAKATHRTTAALSAAASDARLKPAQDRITPVEAALVAYDAGPAPAWAACVLSQFAKMGAEAALAVGVGPGPFGGANPPPKPGGPNPPGGPKPPGGPGLPGPPDGPDPYAAQFGPTNPWDGMPTIVTDFSAPPYDASDYAMKHCDALGDACGPLETDPQCAAAQQGGPSCQEWSAWRQIWVTYSLPDGAPLMPEIDAEVDNDCATSADYTYCPSGTGEWGNCIAGRCVMIPADTPICAGARGYGPFPAEREFEYSCNANFSLCPEGQCLQIATQNAAFQYTLDYPAIVECKRNYSDGALYSGGTIGCRITFRADGPPEDAGVVKAMNFHIIHADVKEAFGDATALHIEQAFVAKWRSEVPPNPCYSYDSYAKKWRYSAYACSGSSGVGNTAAATSSGVGSTGMTSTGAGATGGATVGAGGGAIGASVGPGGGTGAGMGGAP